MAMNRGTQNWPADEIYEMDADELDDAAERLIHFVDRFTYSVMRFLDNRQDRVNAA